MAAATPVSDLRRQLSELDPSNEKDKQDLLDLLRHKDLKEHVRGLKGVDLKEFVESLDKALDRIPTSDDLFRKTLRRLQGTCSYHELLPSSYSLPRGEISDRGKAVVSGGFAEVYEAKYQGEKVCIKAFRLYSQDTTRSVYKTFYQEVTVWKRLEHPNLVPFRGVLTTDESPSLEIVCNWMDNGRITEYVKKHSGADLISLLWDVAEGLHYLHSFKIIHGDLKTANILIDKGGNARLTDFGLASIIRGEDSTQGGPDQLTSKTTTWAAPEVLTGGVVSKEGDVFTFAMVAIEIFTGGPPFTTSYHSALYDIMKEKRPERPEKMDHDGLWQFIQKCWSQDPGQRPDTPGLLKFFQESFPGKRPISEVQARPSTLSTWNLVEPGTDADTSARSPSDPSRQDTQDTVGSGFRDPYAGPPPKSEHKPPPSTSAGGRGTAPVPGKEEPQDKTNTSGGSPLQDEIRSPQSEPREGKIKIFFRKLSCFR